jgi:hypothetical protein
MQTVLIATATAFLSTGATLWVTHFMKQIDRRRDRLAVTMTGLIEWVELPYRIRRRTDDQPETLRTLTEIGHGIQEQFAADEAWIAAHRPRLLQDYRDTRSEISRPVGAAASEAWATAPVTSAEGMNLGEWGPSAACQPHLVAFEKKIGPRFRSFRGN